MSASSSETFVKPLLRGHFHQAAFFVALGACLMLVANSFGQRSFLATMIYSICLVALFGISAAYHRPAWGPKARTWMRRLDHSAIFLLIVGGVLYSIGAVIYAARRPNPYPRVFGYHEIFHVLVIIAAIFHFVVIARLAA